MNRLKPLKTVLSLLLLISLGLPAASMASELGDQLSQALKARIYYLDRDLTTFRYETKSDFEPQRLTDIVSRIKYKTKRFSKISQFNIGWTAGPGTYVAIDPYATRSYGGMDPQLYVLPLKKGTGILDLNAPLTPTEQAVIKLAHDRLQCKLNVESLVPEAYMSFFTLRNSLTEACQALAIEVVHSLKIQAIMYYYAASNELADCRYRQAAFNIVDPSAIDFEKSAVYTNTSLLENSSLSSLVKSLFEETSNDFTLRLNGNDSQTMPLKLQEIASATEPSYSNWKANNLLNCGPKWSMEGNQPLDFSQASYINFKANYKDQDIQDLIIRFKRAFDGKALHQAAFNLSEFYKVAKLLFLASGLEDNEELFRKWVDLQRRQYSDPAAREEFLGLFGANANFGDLSQKQIDLQAWLKNITPNEINSIDFLPRYFSAFGVTNGYQTYLINQMHSYQGGVLILSPDSSLSLKDNLALSKGLYKAALQACIDIYSNSDMTYEEAKQSDCGLL